MKMTVRSMRVEDLAEVVRVQAACYPSDLQETELAFASKLNAGGETSLVMVDRLGRVASYLCCFPWNSCKLMPLGEEEFVRPHQVDSLYIHDLAVDISHRGAKYGREMIEVAVQVARNLGLGKLMLVAVQGSKPFWQSQGFIQSPLFAGSKDLSTYGGDACYMIRVI